MNYGLKFCIKFPFLWRCIRNFFSHSREFIGSISQILTDINCRHITKYRQFLIILVVIHVLSAKLPLSKMIFTKDGVNKACYSYSPSKKVSTNIICRYNLKIKKKGLRFIKFVMAPIREWLDVWTLFWGTVHVWVCP